MNFRDCTQLVLLLLLLTIVSILSGSTSAFVSPSRAAVSSRAKTRTTTLYPNNHHRTPQQTQTKSLSTRTFSSSNINNYENNWDGDDLRFFSRLRRRWRRRSLTLGGSGGNDRRVRNTLLVLSLAAFGYQVFDTISWIVHKHPSYWPQNAPYMIWDCLWATTSVSPLEQQLLFASRRAAWEPLRYWTYSWIHRGWLHLLLNMNELRRQPAWLETGLGHGVYLTTFLLANVAGCWGHQSWALGTQQSFLMGCSAGICGLYGLQLAASAKMGNSGQVYKSLVGLGVVSLYSILLGDNVVSGASHVAGFATGIVAGILLGPSYDTNYQMKRKWSTYVDNEPRDYRQVMGFGKKAIKRSIVPMTLLWMGVLAWVAVTTIPKVRSWTGRGSLFSFLALSMSNVAHGFSPTLVPTFSSAWSTRIRNADRQNLNNAFARATIPQRTLHSSSRTVLKSSFAPFDKKKSRRSRDDDDEDDGDSKRCMDDDKIVIASSFWGSTVVPKNPNQDQNPLPCAPSMDQTGMLPPGAYLSKKEHETSLCRVSLALNLQHCFHDKDLDLTQMTQRMQSFVEDGLTSFQLDASRASDSMVAWGEEEIYGRFLKETPGTVRRHAHLTVPLGLPSTPDVGVDLKSIRKKIKDSLHRMGSSEAIDCIQLHYRPGSFYHLDALDALEELQREGLVVSVSGRNLPPSLLRSASHCGLSSIIVSNQLDLNMVDPSNFNLEQTWLAQDLGIALQASSPLLGGLLSDNFVEKETIPLSFEISANAQHQLKTSLPAWATSRRQDNEKASVLAAWTKFQNDCLPIVHDMSRKYRVPIASVAQRWLLQLEHVDSLVVSTRLSSSNDALDRHFQRQSRKKTYRNVFRFELEEEDMEQLWEISGGAPDLSLSIEQALQEAQDEYDFEENSEGLILPRNTNGKSKGSNGRKLWL